MMAKCKSTFTLKKEYGGDLRYILSLKKNIFPSIPPNEPVAICKRLKNQFIEIN